MNTEVDVAAVVHEFKDDTRRRAYPMVFVSYRTPLVDDVPGSLESRDGRIARLLARGWSLVDTLDSTYPGPSAHDRYRMRFTHTGGDTGRVDLISRRGIEVTATFVPSTHWRTTVAACRHAVLVHGCQYLMNWSTGGWPVIQSAVRSGGLVAATIPVEVRGLRSPNIHTPT
ncbi:hypothetical protein [Amycolatopsis sp. CA-230715]|uniref:hypothetical protein n=1 Tax=Amycolatopsis sp. CA-230715 TaxID=2745196 RepID=UPI001C01670C|nr:hypothetical protein [Amycolatopsis sp. CA-230715]